ncbi:uncharacterized protein LOC127437025 [Myxocyprinus asiaticus]|uniref:uncharacterized protein LOC127437025 n=1 Tax=Myxocyprinus asiaticus TaxID=70543 RepID=UPI0022237585|nr:uncharacterized protein LOC127437025 [Myxocyprinus asiaticus]
MNPADLLLRLRQGNRPLEDYVEDFCGLASQVDFNEVALKDCFRFGLNESISFLMPGGHSSLSLAQYIDLALRFIGSPFTVVEVDAEPEFHVMAAAEPEFHVMAAAEPEFHVKAAAEPEFHVTAMPQPAPCHVTATPQPAPCHVTATPQPAPCHVTATPQPAPCHPDNPTVSTRICYILGRITLCCLPVFCFPSVFHDRLDCHQVSAMMTTNQFPVTIG